MCVCMHVCMYACTLPAKRVAINLSVKWTITPKWSQRRGKRRAPHVLDTKATALCMQTFSARTSKHTHTHTHIKSSILLSAHRLNEDGVEDICRAQQQNQCNFHYFRQQKTKKAVFKWPCRLENTLLLLYIPILFFFLPFSTCSHYKRLRLHIVPCMLQIYFTLLLHKTQQNEYMNILFICFMECKKCC